MGKTYKRRRKSQTYKKHNRHKKKAGVLEHLKDSKFADLNIMSDITNPNKPGVNTQRRHLSRASIRSPNHASSQSHSRSRKGYLHRFTHALKKIMPKRRTRSIIID